MNRLDGRIAIVTGAGRGIGRAHAIALARAGAAVIVNDLGASLAGDVIGENVAEAVSREITEFGGRAAPSTHDIADWSGAKALVEQAIGEFGDLHIVINNAGVLRDKTLANLSEDDWDFVVRVHLKGHAAMTRHAMQYWRDEAKQGRAASRSLVHTTSISAFSGKLGQAAYASAKLAVVALSNCAAFEGTNYGVRSNAVAPTAHTRLDPRLAPDGETAFDMFAPENVSPLVVWLAGSTCQANGQVFQAYGNRINVIDIARIAESFTTAAQWDIADIERCVAGGLLTKSTTSDFLPELRQFIQAASQ